MSIGGRASVCRDRWIAIRKGNRTCYAQWEDCGPFRTDHFQYVFGNERPKPNLNHGAGLDVSPAVRDYLGLAPTDVTDWQFVEVRDVSSGPCGATAKITTLSSHAVRTSSEWRIAAGRREEVSTSGQPNRLAKTPVRELEKGIQRHSVEGFRWVEDSDGRGEPPPFELAPIP